MRSTWLIVSLLISAGVNMFLIGAAVAVTILAVATAKNRQEAPRPGPIVVATQGLPQSERQDLRQTLSDVRRQARPDTDRSLQLRLQAWGALADPKPDVAAIKQQLAQARQLDVGVRTKVEEALVDFVAGQNPQDRATFAVGMRRVLIPMPPAQAQPRPQAAATNATG
jgi:uncharacterized membrane protein